MGASRIKLLSQIWLPTLVLIVVVAAGFAINAAYGVVGSQDRTQSPHSLVRCDDHRGLNV
jgi:hypothetical protein